MATSTLRQSPVTLVVGLAALTAAAIYLVGWPLPVVIGAIIVMVMGHEFGHYITAKRAGLLVTDFFVGFGPVLWSRTIGETRYGVRAFLLGGYVKIPGMTWQETLDPAIESRTYRSASYPRRVLFASAGSLMHLIMALLLAWASLSLVGLPSASHVGIEAFESWDGHARNAAQIAGLHLGDQIVSIDGVAITSAEKLVNLVHDHAGRQLVFRVDRHGRLLTLHATPVDGRTLKSGGATLDTGTKPVGLLGILLTSQVVRVSPLAAIPQSGRQVVDVVGASVRGLAHVFSPGEFASLFHQVASPVAAANPQNQLNRPESIVGVVRLAVQGTQASGVGVLLNILMTVNVFVGLMNMIPLLPLDGGYVAVATYERLRSRRGQTYHAEVSKLNPLIYTFVSLLLVLFACTLYLDIAHPIANPF